MTAKTEDSLGELKMNLGKKDKKKAVPEKSKDRLEILEEIERLEREGKFDVDPEKDPPTITLLPEDVDYLKEKRSTRVKNKLANKVGMKFLDELLRTNKLIIREVNGLEHMNEVEGGAILTCNHFNPFDCFTMENVFRMTEHHKEKTLYKVIREGNYTNFPGLYGFFFRHCDTLPLSSNMKTMVEFMKAVNTVLQEGDWILIYPEQSLWWNYKKPKPLKNGAFKFAAHNQVPVIPTFITMTDSDKIGPDGFPVQEYIVNIGEPIYPDPEKKERENAEAMRDKNYEVWKKVYEDFYGMPLVYTTEQKDA